MKRKRFTEEQIVAILKEASASDNARLVVRKHGITETTFYRWKAKYGGIGVPEVKRLKALEEENARLKRLVADLSLDNVMLRDVVHHLFALRQPAQDLVHHRGLHHGPCLRSVRPRRSYLRTLPCQSLLHTDLLRWR